MPTISHLLGVTLQLRQVFLFSIFLITSACSSFPYQEEDEEVLDVPDTPSIEFNFPLTNYRRISRGYKGRHRGIDISAPKGTKIYAAESGWITYQGSKFHGYGKLVIIEHSKSWATFYAHMNSFHTKEKTWVNKGDVVGYVGHTGRSRGDHLHFEIRYKNRPIDPLGYFNTSKLKFARR
ncbi:M23 family metallopeptidase [bacterium]|nr:M23 family metallopeptidase [bacterium]